MTPIGKNATATSEGGACAFTASERSIIHVLRRRVVDMPDKPWLVFEDFTVTYRDADRLSNRLANGLRGAGLSPGDTLLVMLPDGIDLVLSWLACAKLGVIEVPVNTAYRGDILAHVIRDSRARTMLVSSLYLDRLRDLDGLGSLERCFVQGEGSDGSSSFAGLEMAKLDTLMSDDARRDRPRR